ncbi:MAG: prenyltransferase [Gemmatimonadaceae bacterium]|nr:prenyltransferase [Gemmatimonadaceae bacterium]
MENSRTAPLGASVGTVGRAALYLQAMRVKSLWISSICVLAGGAVALWQGHVNLAGLCFAWLGAVSVQAGTNLTNVFYNYKSTSPRSGGTPFDPQGSAAPVRLGHLAPASVHSAALACFAVGLVAGIALTAMFGWRILAMGVPGLLAGYFYGAPPVRLAYLGLGVITVFLFMGPVMVIGTYWVQSGSVSTNAVLASLPIGLLAASIMHVNDIRDFASDVAHGKRTLSIALGRQRAGWLLVAMDATAYLAVVVGVARSLLPWPVLLTLITVPRAIAQTRTVIRERDPVVLNGAWFLSVQIHTQFGLLFIGGLALAHALRASR